jgi:hypothetical protein
MKRMRRTKTLWEKVARNHRRSMAYRRKTSMTCRQSVPTLICHSMLLTVYHAFVCDRKSYSQNFAVQNFDGTKSCHDKVLQRKL